MRLACNFRGSNNNTNYAEIKHISVFWFDSGIKDILGSQVPLYFFGRPSDL